jgi:hypothetical protein
MRSERARLRQQAPIFHIGPTWCRLDHAGSEISPLEPTRLRESDDGLKPEQVGFLWPAGFGKRLGLGIEQRSASEAVLFGQFEQLVRRAVGKTPSFSKIWA